MGWDRDSGQDPRSLIVEFARTDDGGDPFAFRFESQTYLVRGPGGSYREITVPWRGPLWDELSAMEGSPELCQRLGDRLRGLLEAAEWDRIEDALRSASAEAPVVLTIRAAAAELFALPWGLVTLESDGRHIAELRHVLLRHEWSGAEPPTPASEAAPRVLVAWSAAGGAVPSAAHIDAIARACEQRGIAFDRTTDVVDHVSPRRLAEALDEPTRPATALHLLCHGEAAEGGAGLLFDGDGSDERGSKLVDAGALRRLLGRHAADLRLVAVAACASGSPSQRASHLGSVAQALHRVGVEAVVASRTALSVDGSIALTRDLYRGLLVHSLSLEAAMMRARARLVHGAGLDWAALQLYAGSDAGTDTRPFALRPYRGLLSFDESDRPYFFGREREIAALRDWAEEAAAGARGLHFIVGGSGSGKLSLLRAGLIPALRGRRTRRWRVAVIRPGDDRERPQSALSAAFVRAMGDALAVDSRASVDALLATLRGASEQGESLLLIVSRFEEVFTHLPSRAQATAYVRALAELAACPGVAVAATLRTDFIPRCAELRLADGRRLDELLYDDHERMLLGPPGAAALRDLIVGPARAVGIRLEPALVERLVADIEGEAAALPLLQHCLDLLWTERRGRLLTLESYERLGRIAGALARSADAVLAGLRPEERDQARCLLVALIDLGEDLAPRGRRRLDRELLRPLVDSAQADFDRVVDVLSEGRLIVTGATMAGDAASKRGRGRSRRAPTVWLDLAHEALIERWPTLRAWLDEDRVDLLALRRVVSAYQEWRAHLSERRARYDYLLVGDRLQEALRLTRRRPGLVPGPVLVFIYESEELVAASRMRGLVERLLPTYAAPLALAFLPGLAALEQAPRIGLATIPAVIAGVIVSLTTLRAWGWAVLVQERVLSPAPVDSAIHAWILSALAALAAWGAAGGHDLSDIFWLLPWSGWISLALAALALGRALLVARVVRHEPSARRWGRGQLVVALACVGLDLGALASVHPWALWLAALALDVTCAALLRPRLEPRGGDDGRTTAGKIDDAAVVAAAIVILVGLPATVADGPALLCLAVMIGPSLGLLSALALESRRAHTRDDAARGDLPQATPIDARWLLTRAPLLVGISLAGAAGQRLVAADGDVGRGAWSLALLLFFLGVLLDRSAARSQADRGRRIAYVAASIAAVAPALTLAFRDLPAPPWALSLATLAVIGLWVTRGEILPRWAKRRILSAEAAARVTRTGPDSAALVETLTHTGSGLLLRDDPEYKAIVGRPW